MKPAVLGHLSLGHLLEHATFGWLTYFSCKTQNNKCMSYLGNDGWSQSYNRSTKLDPFFTQSKTRDWSRSNASARHQAAMGQPSSPCTLSPPVRTPWSLSVFSLDADANAAPCCSSHGDLPCSQLLRV